MRATGGLDPSWASTGIIYTVEIVSPASDEDVDQLVRLVDEIAEMPKALRSGTTVVRRRAN